MVPYHHTAMVNFTKKHWVGKFATGWESRVCRKPLTAAAAAVVMGEMAHAS